MKEVYVVTNCESLGYGIRVTLLGAFSSVEEAKRQIPGLTDDQIEKVSIDTTVNINLGYYQE